MLDVRFTSTLKKVSCKYSPSRANNLCYLLLVTFIIIIISSSSTVITILFIIIIIIKFIITIFLTIFIQSNKKQYNNFVTFHSYDYLMSSLYQLTISQ